MHLNFLRIYPGYERLDAHGGVMIGARDSVIFALPLPPAGEGEHDRVTISAVNI